MNKYKNNYSSFNVKNTLIKTFVNYYSRKVVYAVDNTITYR